LREIQLWNLEQLSRPTVNTSCAGFTFSYISRSNILFHVVMRNGRRWLRDHEMMISEG